MLFWTRPPACSWNMLPAILLVWLIVGRAGAAVPCRIEVVEKGTGWPVPLVELRTIHHERFVTDNAGRIAFDLPELMGRETWFDVIGQGYEVPRDGFGFRGVRLTPDRAGRSASRSAARSSPDG